MSVEKVRKTGLGRGLSALMADIEPEVTKAPLAKISDLIPIEQLTANPDQPRRTFSPDALQELADSLRGRGIIQPLIVRRHPHDDGLYQIVAGERRWRAAQMAQLHEVPVIVREFSDEEMLEVAIIENVQRAELNAIEEAASYKQLMSRFGHTQEKIAEALGKSRSHIANLLRLLTLPDQVQVWVKDEKLTPGHARALITSPDPVGMAQKVISRGLSVRDTEALVSAAQSPQKKAAKKIVDNKDADTRALEADLGAQLGMQVSIKHTSAGGQLSISYKDLEQLDRLCRVLGG